MNCSYQSCFCTLIVKNDLKMSTFYINYNSIKKDYLQTEEAENIEDSLGNYENIYKSF